MFVSKLLICWAAFYDFSDSHWNHLISHLNYLGIPHGIGAMLRKSYEWLTMTYQILHIQMNAFTGKTASSRVGGGTTHMCQ